MCSYLLRAPNGRYYFRMAIPAKLRPSMGGRREIKQALGTADRDTAKLLIPDLTKAAQASLAKAERAIAAPSATHAAPARPKSPAALERERARWEWEQEQAELADAEQSDRDSEIEALEPIMDAIEAGTVPDAPTADIVRAGQLLAIHQRQMGDIRVQEAESKWDRASARNIQAVQCEPGASEPTKVAEPARSITKLYERWASSGSGNPKTVSKWRNMVAALVKHLGHDDVTKVTRADLNAWVETLVAKGLTGKTIRAGYLPAIKVPFTLAFEDEVIPKNTASELKVRAPKVVKLRERDLTDDEAAMILKATLGPQPDKLAEDHARARRWVPWLLAYTGARVGEITQLRAMDIQQEDDVWFIHITPEAGSVKNAQARKVPLHSHLIEQGFIKLAKAGDATPLFYREGTGNAVNPPSKIRAGHISRWVSSLGVTASQPNHGWRHRFKSQAFAVNMDNEAADIMQGHKPRAEAGKYGQRGLPRLKDELEKLPRYAVEVPS